MTRTPRDPQTGKPLPSALRDEPGACEWVDEPTLAGVPPVGHERVPSSDELEDELAQHGATDDLWRRRQR